MKLTVRAGDRRSWFGIVMMASLLLLLAAGALYFGGKREIRFASATSAEGSPWELGKTVGSGLHLPPDRPRIELASSRLNFEANRGQTSGEVNFLARGSGYTLFLLQHEAVLNLQAPVNSRRSVIGHARFPANSHPQATAIRMKLIGADPHATIVGDRELPGRSSYLIGNNPWKWRTNVPQYERVRYQQVYPGIDLVYYGNQGRLEYDFEVAPGEEPGRINLRVEGASAIKMQGGDLLATTAAGDVRLGAPEIYQVVDGQKKPVRGRFELSAGNTVRFAIDGYDRSRTLVIDPVLNFSAFLGGSGDEGCTAAGVGKAVSGCPAIAADTAGNIYVAGSTTSADFPAAGTALQGASTLPDLFIAKYALQAGVYTLAYSTYLGGDAIDTSAGIAVDSSQNIYVAGNTSSSDFPVTANANQSSASAGSHGFVSVLNNTGSALIYSTYLAGNATDTITGLAIDTAANAYVTGITTSTGAGSFPITTNAFQGTAQSVANPQFFITEFATTKSSGSLAYSTYFGGNAPASGATVEGGGIAVDTSGNIYITGGTNFLSAPNGNFPILNAFQSCLDAPGATSCSSATNSDAFVAKLRPTNLPGAQLQYSTYFGGGGNEVGYGIAVDASGNAYITGSTDSGNLPIASTTNAFQAAFGGGATDAFVARFGTSGTPVALSYSSYLGGTGNDVGYAIAADPNGGAHVAGSTTTGFPQVSQLTGTGPGTGATNAFVALLQTSFIGQTGGYSSYLEANGAGGTADATGVAVDGSANTYVAGESTGGILTTTGPATVSGSSDAFVGKIVPSSVGITMTPTTSVAANSTIGIGNQVTFTYTIKNTGPDVASGLVFTDNLPSTGATFASATTTPGSCTAVVNATVTCAIGSLGVNAQAVVKINLTPSVTGSLGNSGNLQANGIPILTKSATVTVSDFGVSVGPTTNTVVAGNTATYQVQVGDVAGQTSFFPNAVSLSCSAGVPAGAACTFSTNPLTMTNTSAISSTLTLTTTARPVTTGSLQHSRYVYAVFLPIAGLSFLGLGVGAGRWRKCALVIFALLVFGLVGLQLACSSGSGTTTPSSGTPAGTYTITLTGTSGSASHATRMTLVVQ